MILIATGSNVMYEKNASNNLENLLTNSIYNTRKNIPCIFYVRHYSTW